MSDAMAALRLSFRDRLMKASICAFALAFVFAGMVAFGQSGIDVPEFQARRRAGLEKVPDGIILLRTAWGLKRWDESGFHQFGHVTGARGRRTE